MDVTYLLFGHRGARFGVDVRAVKEIFWLPDLSPVEELAPSITGVFNLRGKIVPVMDLALRFGHPQEHYKLSDQVIVLACDEALIGIITNEVHDVLTLAPDAIEIVQNYQGIGGQTQFVTGEAKLADGLATLLDVDALLKSAPSPEALLVHASADTAQALLPLFGPMAPADTQTLQHRARSLAEVHETGERAGRENFVVIRLNNELFGIPLEIVREFTHLRGVTPIPCCPAPIVGNMNLRGDILMLVDIRPTLDMAMNEAMNKVVVVRIGDLLVGLPAAEIINVVQLAPEEISSIPIASDSTGKACCKGVATVDGQAISILDLEKILSDRAFHVTQMAT